MKLYYYTTYQDHVEFYAQDEEEARQKVKDIPGIIFFGEK